MKKFITLLLLSITAFSLKSNAQTCSAGFDFSVSGLTVTFTPAVTTNLSSNHQYWRFGDGTLSSDISPVHVYASAGVYTVTHIFYRAENGTTLCLDSVQKKVELTALTNVCNLHAKFSYERDSSQSNKIKFTNLSSPTSAVLYTKWSFGDGTYSNDFNASHVYATSGAYTVCLTVVNSTSTPNVCYRDTCMIIQVQVPPPPCNFEPNFEWKADSINSLKVFFHSSISPVPGSTAPTYMWSFGDNTTSTSANPDHIYAQAGTYNVCLRVALSNTCFKYVCKTVEVRKPVPVCNLHAKFSYERDASQSNKINFTNLSTPVADIHFVKWSFGDGTTSTDFNTSHVYANSGAYTVCLTVVNSTNTANACYRDTCMTIQVQVPPPCNFEPNFEWKADSTNSLKVYFHSSVSPAGTVPTYTWSFGDNTTSTSANPDHIYAQAGIYNVCLKVALSSTCYKYICKSVEVKQPAVLCNIQPYFSWRADSANSKKIYFTNQTILSSTNVKVAWSFGDGSSSNLWNPDHTYEHGGTYTVCLTIYTSSICVRQFCKTIEVKEPEVNCQDISKFSFLRSTVNCLEFKFVPAILNANWKYVWSFGDGTGSTDISPSHVYQRSGNYTVFLTVFRSNNCVSTSYQLIQTGECFSCNNIWVKFEYTRSASNNYIAFHAASNYPILSQTWTITKLTVSGSVPVILNQNNPTYQFTEPGDYRVCLRAVTQGQCIKEYCDVIHIYAPITYCTLESFPNPTHNTVTFNVPLSSPQMIHVYIYNSLNVLVAQKDQQGSTGNNVVSTNIENLIPGYYNVRIVYGNQICYSKFQKI